MKPTEHNLDELLHQYLGLYKPAFRQQSNAAREANLDRLRAQAPAASKDESAAPSSEWRLSRFSVAAAAAFTFLLLTIIALRNLPPLHEKTASNRRAPDYLAAPQQGPAGAGLAFEVASIRPVNASGGARGASAGPAPLIVRCMRPYLQVRVDAVMFAASASVYDLISLAYSAQCASIQGGPDWASTNRFEIRATIPKGRPSYTVAQLRAGEAPELQAMIQTLLTERFRLSIHRELQESPVYDLVVAKEGKLKPAQGPSRTEPGRPRVRVPSMGSNETTVRRFAEGLTGQLDRPVIDKTGRRGSYAMVLEFPELATAAPVQADGSPLRMRDLIPEKLEEQLGLKLVPATAHLEILLINRVDKPSEN